MEILKYIGGVIGWLAGVAGGIVAILYAFGFLATNEHQDLLGLRWGVISRDTLWYVGVGSQVIANWTLRAFLVFMLILFSGQFLVLIFGLTAKLDGTRYSPLRGIARWLDRNIVWCIAILSLLLVAKIGSSAGHINSVANFLFLDANHYCQLGLDQEDKQFNALLAALVKYDSSALTGEFGEISLLSAVALSVGAYALPRIIHGAEAPIPLFICIAASATAVFYVPVAYGRLMIETQWRTVSINGAESMVGDIDNRPRILGRTPDGIWIWNPHEPSVRLLRGDKAADLTIGQKRSVWEIFDCEKLRNPAEALEKG